MKKRTKRQLTGAIMLMISSLAIGCVFYGFLREGRIFAVNAEQLGETTPASRIVSKTDFVSPADLRPPAGAVSSSDAKNSQKIVFGGSAELIPHANPALSLIPYTMTHLLEIDGHPYRTANPNNGGSGKVTCYYLDSETGSNVTYVENSFPFNQDTSTGNLAYGCDFVIDLSGSRYDNRGLNCAEAAGYGYVTVTCTDGTPVRWNASSKDKYTSGWNSIQRYYFTWSMLEEALDGKTPQSVAINAEEGIPSPYPMGIFRHSTDSQLTLESLHPDSVYGLFYDAEACEYGSGYDYIQNWKLDDTIRVADSTLSFPSGYNSSALSCSVHGTMQFYITENNPGKRITGVNVSGPGTAAYDETAGKWLVTCNSTDPYFIDVQEENVTGSSSYRLDVEATSTDYSMNGIQISDNFNGSSFYSSYKPTRHYFSTFPMNMRFSDAACTSAYGPGEGGKTRSGSNQVKVTNYHRNENLDNWYATIIAYGAEGVTGYNTSTGGPRTVKIENVSFLNEDTGETLNISYSTGMKGYSPFISFLPPACNLKVTLDVKYTDERVNIHLHETRPTNLDTAWASYFSRCQILVPGDDNKLATQKTYHYGHSNDPNSYNLGTDLDWYENIGTFLSGHSFNYGLYYCNGFSSFVTMVKEWHIYPADADGKKIEGAAPIDHIFNYTYTPTTDADYVNKDAGSRTHSAAVPVRTFDVPSLEDLTIDGVTYHDVVIEITYGHAIGKWDVTQLINNEDGTTSAADENFKLSFTGTARTVTAKADDEPEQQRPFYESTSPDSPVVLTNNASTGKATLGIFRGTSNVSFTASAPEGYRVSYIDYRLGNSSDNYANSRMTRNGDTFTITNLPALNDSNNTLNRRITVYYSKSASVEVHQETDGEVIAGSSSKIGTVTLSTQNSGSYISSIATVMMNRSMASVFTENAGENSYDELMYSSVGNKPTVTVQVGAASRVIQSVTLSVKRNGVVTELVKGTDYTETTHTFSKAEYKLNCMLGLNDTLYVNVRYASATRINVRILEKKTTDDSTLIPMSVEAGAVVTVTGTGAVTGEGASGYQFMNYPNGNQKVNSFTVSDGNPVNYTTQGSTKLTIHVELPEGSPYVVANVDACKMVNDAPGASLGDVVVPASNQEITGYGNCRDYSTSSFNMTGTNVCLRVILAKTADVTVSFRSRGGNTDSLFADNTVSNAYMSMTHSNQCYGGAVFPVIINNGTNTFNTDSYTVGLDPSTRTVRSIDRSLGMLSAMPIDVLKSGELF